jgi:hypothetical protein
LRYRLVPLLGLLDETILVDLDFHSTEQRLCYFLYLLVLTIYHSLLKGTKEILRAPFIVKGSIPICHYLRQASFFAG